MKHKSEVGSLSKRLADIADVPSKCRCGGKPIAPVRVPDCENRWTICCSINTCLARNTGQGLKDTIIGWNRLSTHFYR
ncbi:hypothetical protein [Paraglaciecola mesophila]|uniref:hypothetical protein n=1 Tax=Paraglaciecola mesophila TaxID=197222 RepID=UPI0013636B94|nr:hypothetical protein [Paraglaciecola mesophila]